MNPLEYTPSAVPDAPRLDGEKHLLFVAAGSPKPVELPKNAAPAHLTRLQDRLQADLDVHLALQLKLPPVFDLPATPTLKDRVAAARRKLAELRTAAHVADITVSRGQVISLLQALA